jgi:hypothetical protein
MKEGNFVLIMFLSVYHDMTHLYHHLLHESQYKSMGEIRTKLDNDGEREENSI